MKLPNCKTPCNACPFRKDTRKGWLGSQRMTEILEADTFVCHKSVDYSIEDADEDRNRLQCAGHMIIKGEENTFVRTANIMGIETELKGADLVFDSKEECITHHKTK